MTEILGGAADQPTLCHDALFLAFEALCRRLLDNGVLRRADLPAMRIATLAFTVSLTSTPNSKLQVSGVRLTESVAVLFDRLDRRDRKPVSSEDVWRTARMLTADRGHDDAHAFAWRRVCELAVARDRLGVETWCWILDALDELRRADGS